MKRFVSRTFIVALMLGFSVSLAFAGMQGGKAEDRPVLKQMIASAKSQITEVSVGEARRLLNTSDNIVLVDVRTLQEFQGGHLLGAIHLDRGKLEFLAERKLRNKTQPILVYCKSGARGALATLTLGKMGYSNVKNIAGAYLAWKKAGYQVVK